MTDTEREKHRSGGPGKSARDAHEPPGKGGNKPGQNQAGSGDVERRGSERFRKDVKKPD